MLRTFLALLVLFAAVANAVVVAAAERNVILFVTDDESRTLGCYGNEVIKTPHIDALAADGTRFDYANCTTASCSASRSVILTGLHNHANGHYGHEHSYHHFRSFDRVRSLPVLMSQAGYRTVQIGKLHVGPPEVYRFDQQLEGGSARNPVMMADACQSLFASDDERPFFLYFCTADPHRGGGTVEGDEHGSNAFGNRPGGYPGIEPVKYEPDDVLVPPFLPDTPACRAELAQYYESCSRADQGLGRLVELLKAAGLYDKTLILFTSDHGMAFPGGKTTLYEGGMNVPLVARNPYQAKRGNVCDALVNHTDLTPTILDFAGGLNEPKNFHGRSFLGAMAEESPQGWDEIYASHTFHEITMYYPMRVVRNRQYKLIWNIAHDLPYPFASDLWAAAAWQAQYKQGPQAMYGPRTVHDYIHRPEFELFDMASDPDETKNLADDPRYASTLEELKGKIKAFQQRTGDPWILKWEYE